MNFNYSLDVLEMYNEILHSKTVTIYHGSDHIINQPIYGLGKKANDFGVGFYTTPDELQGKIWGSRNETENSYCNKYEYNMEGLKVLDLYNSKYNILNWLALLIENRDFNVNGANAAANKKYIIDNFSINLDDYDVIIGPRADSSYFTWAKEFVYDQLKLEQLDKSMKMPNLGIQIVLKSEKAFDPNRINFILAEKLEEKDYRTYSAIGRTNEREANEKYEFIRDNEQSENDLTVSDIRKGGFKNEDFCRSISSEICR